MRDLMANFLANGETFVEYKEAQKILGRLTITQLNDAVTSFSKAVNEVKENALPPTSAGA
jgi:hypothetical protein